MALLTTIAFIGIISIAIASTGLPINDKIKSTYKIAFLCGFIPFILGISIFLLWLVSRWEILMFAGILNIYAGICAFIIGALCLGYHFIMSLIHIKPLQQGFWISNIACLSLLCSNFIAAGLIIFYVLEAFH